MAVGASPRAATTDTFLVPPELRQDDRLEGLPFGTRGGTSLRYTFPRDGEYSVRVQLTRYAGASFDDIPVFDETQRLELSVDGTPRACLRAALRDERRPRMDQDRIGARSMPTGRSASRKGGAADRRADVPQPDAGAARKPSRAVRRSRFRADRTATTRRRRARIFAAIEISGPVSTPLAPETRRAASGSSSAGPIAEPTSDERRRARRRFSRRWPAARSGGRSPTRICRRCSPSMRRAADDGGRGFRARHRARGRRPAGQPRVPVPHRAGTATAARRRSESDIYRISDLELASRLSFFLWSSIPDDALLDAASSGQAAEPGSARAAGAAHARRPSRRRAGHAISSGSGCSCETSRPCCPIPKRDPDFDEDLRQGFRRETELFAGSILREDRSVLDLLTGELHVRERAAREALRHSEHPRHAFPPRRAQRRQPPRAARPRQHARRSPRSRIARRRSCAASGFSRTCSARQLPPPPPDVPALKEKPNPADEELSMRERIAQHRANPACASCHAMMDPLGLSLENFDFVGRWRDRRRGAAFRLTRRWRCRTARSSTARPACATFWSAIPIGSCRTLTEKMLTYALGRGLEHYDMPAVRKITRDAARNNYRASSIVAGRRQQSSLPDAEAAVMIITKMALPRRTFLRGLGRDRSRCRCSTRWCRRLSATAQRRRRSRYAAWGSSTCPTASR